jgi:hypothetical protein
MKNSKRMNLFFEWCKKNIIWILTILLVIIVLVANLTFRGNKIISNPPLGLGFSESENPVASRTTSSVLYGSGLPQTSDVVYPSGSFSPPKNLQDVAKIISLLSLPDTSFTQNNILSLPDVLNNEININLSGVDTIQKYFSNLAEISNLQKPFYNVLSSADFLKDEKGNPLLPAELANLSMNGGDNLKIKKSLIIWKEVNNKSIAEYKKIPIKDTGYLILAHKINLGMGLLNNDLIDKINSYIDGSLSKNSLQEYLTSFKNTQDLYSRKISDIAQGIAPTSAFNFFINRANAAGISLPFGGMVTAMYPCCNGVLYTVGPPGPVGNYLAIPATIWYMFRAGHSGAWFLGLYLPGMQCQTGSFCTVTIPTLGTITIVGTSG